MPDHAARREQQRRFARAREAERGDYDADRGDYDADRGDYDADRGDYDADRGDYDADRGGGRGGAPGGAQANRVAADIFQRASGLGGHLIVAFVAPVGASAASRPRARRRRSSSQAEAAAASAQVAALMDQIRQAFAATGKQTTASPAPSSEAPGPKPTSTYLSTQQ